MAELNLDKTIYDDFYDEFPKATVTEVRNSLAAFMFYGEDVFKKINMLSGGEKVRLALCKILKKGPNFLILDEPTNHMDIIGKESLENLLKEYEGTIIFVSHDRFFIKKVSDSILAFENNKVTFYRYGYEEYLEKRETLLEERKNEISEKKPLKTYSNPLKEKSRLERLLKKAEDDITAKENKVFEYKKALTKEEIYSDYIKVTEIQTEIEQLNKQIENDILKWEQIQDEINNIN